MSTREELIYLCRIAEQTERYEDMVEYMKELIQKETELSLEERNLLSVAYKNTIGSRRTAWRVACSLEEREEKIGGRHKQEIQNYKLKIIGELNKYCNEILKLLEEKIIPLATTAESKVFLWKMKGDYHRYISEYATGDELKKHSKDGLEIYQKATDLATKELKTTMPVRLGLALNFSVFYYEVMNEHSQACKVAKLAFDDAIADIEHIDEDQYKDATTIMQLIRDNLTLWTSELHDNDEEDGTNVENL